MKPNRRKAVVSDPIKRIGLNGGNSAREIVIQIARVLGFKIHEDNKGVSAYGGNSIRIADHCTYMQTWVDNGTWNAPIRLDVVIEDEPTEAVTQVSIGYDFGITEFVSQSNDIDPQKARIIAYDIRNTMNGNPYANNVRGERHNLVATHDNNPQQINCNTNMNKKLIRLTESDLHKIVKESVNRVLTELDWKTYASAAKKRGIQGDPKGTMHDLSNAATRALRDSHPTDGHKYNDEYPSIETFNDDYHGHAQKGMVPGLGSYNPYDGIPTDTYVDEFDKDRESWKRLNRRPDALQRDMDGYFSGKSKYVKGKGWQ